MVACFSPWPAATTRAASPGRRDDVVRIGLGFVAQPLGIGVGPLHVTEAFDDRFRRIGLLQQHLRDLNAGVIAVEDVLRLLHHVAGDLGPHRTERGLDRRAAHDFAQDAFGNRFDGDIRVAGLEQIVERVVDAPEQGKIDVDDVLSPVGWAFGRDFAAAGGICRFVFRGAGAIADLDTVDACDGRGFGAIRSARGDGNSGPAAWCG